MTNYDLKPLDPMRRCGTQEEMTDAYDTYEVVPEDGVVVRGKQRHLHEASLEVLGTYFGVVAPSRGIEAVWAEHSAGTLPAETAHTAAPSGI
jgi:hypothetical protein